MIISFLLGLLAVVAVVAVVALVVMGFLWLKDYIKKRLKEKENHKVAFVDTREVVDEYVQNKAKYSEEISMDDLERMCEETPFVSATIDNKTGEISDYEGVKAEEVESNLKSKIESNDGILIFG